MSSNLKICINLRSGQPLDALLPELWECIVSIEFELHESANDICERGRKTGPGGHVAFAIMFRHSNGPVTVWMKFSGYGLVNRVVFEPGNQLWAGAIAYPKCDYIFIIALHQLVKNCFEKMEAEQAIARLDDVEEPWFRFSKTQKAIPLSELILERGDD